MNITRACISVSLAFMTSAAAVPLAHAGPGGGAASGSPWGNPGALSQAALELELASTIDSAGEPEAQEARHALDDYVQQLTAVRRTVKSVPAELAKQRLTEAESQFALARLQAYAGAWAECAEAAGQALAHLESAGDLANAWRSEKRGFDLVIEDLDGTLQRARKMVVVSGFDPGASATLLHAEHARAEADRIAGEGRIQSARWKAENARDLAVIAMEQATGTAMRPPGKSPDRPTWIARHTPHGIRGSGGDVR